MTQDETQPEIIDIDPENIIENKPVEKPAPKGNALRYGVVAALMLASAAGGSWAYRDMLASYLPSDQMKAVSARVDILEAGDKKLAEKLDAVVGLTDELKSQLGAAQSAAEDARKVVAKVQPDLVNAQSKMAALEKSLADSMASVDQLKSQIASGGQTGLKSQIASGGQTGAPVDISGLTARVDALEQALAHVKEAGAATRPDASQIAQALDQMMAKITAGTAYPDEIAALSKMVPAADGLDVLSANADKGVVTLSALADSIKAMATEMQRADEMPAAVDDSWLGRASQALSGLVTVKDVGAPDWKAIATQCADLTSQDKLADALKLLDQHVEQLPKPLQVWRLVAGKRLAVDQALEKTSRAVAREIAARG